MSKLTRTLICMNSFFPDYCLIHDLSTKLITSRGRKSLGLYILGLEVPNLLLVLELLPHSNYIVV